MIDDEEYMCALNPEIKREIDDDVRDGHDSDEEENGNIEVDLHHLTETYLKKNASVLHDEFRKKCILEINVENTL